MDERLAAFHENPDDPSLAALYFQFGRYLLISSTRVGLLPAVAQRLMVETVTLIIRADMQVINIDLGRFGDLGVAVFHIAFAQPQAAAAPRGNTPPDRQGQRKRLRFGAFKNVFYSRAGKNGAGAGDWQKAV